MRREHATEHHQKKGKSYGKSYGDSYSNSALEDLPFTRSDVIAMPKPSISVPRSTMYDVVIDKTGRCRLPSSSAGRRMRAAGCGQCTVNNRLHTVAGVRGVQVGRTKRALERGACEILTSCTDLTPRR